MPSSHLRHWYRTRAEVLRIEASLEDGAAIITWTKVQNVIDPYLGRVGELMCKIDLLFMRPGKDAPMPFTSGRAPDRMGILFCDQTPELKAGDRVHCLSGPVTGVFEIRSIPDIAQDYLGSHHLEVQVVEVQQNVVYPGGGIEGEWEG